MFRVPLLYLGASLVVVFCVSAFAYAASDSFTVSTLIGSDTTAPTTPTNLTATPVATTQIDLSWDASTDNFSLSGYQVFRDSVQISTTSSTSYSDTGLTENTLYTYYVTAYDSSENISSSSASVSTTTLSTPPAEETTTSSEEGGISAGSPALDLVSLEIIPGTTFAVLNWTTTTYVRSVVRWGATASYELGSVAESTFGLTHTTLISNLLPNTRYYFSIAGEDGVGFQRVFITNSFTTLAVPDIAPPANVTDLVAEKVGNDIRLTWNNPYDPDFDHVRILRSDRFYPSDFADGALIYEGDDETFLDIGSAVPGTTQYFTLFSYDDRGNISSGAIVALRIDKEGNVVTVTPSSIPLAPNAVEVSLNDLIFEQEGYVLHPVNGSINIDGTKQLTISLPAGVLAERLKSIVVTVFEGDTNKSFSFLLRINDDKTQYTASIAPFGMDGRFPMAISVFDYGIQKIAETKGTLVASVGSLPEASAKRNYLLYFLGFLLLLLVLAWRLFRVGGWGIRRVHR